MKSLRTRLALFSSLVSGIIIVLLGFFVWSYIRKTLLESVDLRLAVPAGRFISELHPRVNFDVIASRVQIGYGDDIASGEKLILIRDAQDDATIFQGPDGTDWLSQIDESFVKGSQEEIDRLKNSPPRPQFSQSDQRRTPTDSVEDPDAFFRELLGDSPQPRGEKGYGKGKGDFPKGGGKGGGLRPEERAASMDMNYRTQAINGKEYRLAVGRQRGYIVMIGINLEETKAELDHIKNRFLIGIPLALILIGGSGWLVANRAMQPVKMIAETAAHFSAKRLDERIPKGAHIDTELSELVDVLNAMMERLEHSFMHVNRFSADVSHELKTPLAVMQGTIETALRDCAPGSGEEENLLSLQKESQRLKTITSSLMILAQADSGHLATRWKETSLSQEIEAICEDAEIVCESKNITFKSKIEPDLKVETDPNLLRQAIQNLISNAVKYNQENGTVKFTLSDSGDGYAVIKVANTGPGIPENEREKIFDRFHRADKARSRNIDGFGLGLNLAMEIIRGLGGDLSLARADEKITEFEIWLPLSTPGS